MASTNTSLKRKETPKRSPEMSEDEDDASENVQKTARESTAKRQRLRKGLSGNKILVPSERSARASASTEGSSDSALENSSRTMRGSLRIRAVVNYDMHFHPADLVLRPNHAATKAAREMAREGNNSGDEDTGAATDDDGASEDQSSQLESPETDNATDSKGATKTDFAVVVPVIPGYRATRSGRNVKAANYDMKHHPMDETLRPKAAAKRSVRFQGLSPSPGPQSIPPENSKKAKHGANGSPRTVQPVHEDHFNNPPTTGWYDLGDLDRRLFQLQKGTPLESNIIPMSWCRVVKQLREENLLSHQQLGASGGYAALKAHYEEVRHAVVRLFDAEAEEEPHNKEQVEWMCAEGFEVYRLPRGQRYWRHKRDSVLPSMTTLHDSNYRTGADGTLSPAKNIEPGEAPMARSGSDTSHDSRLLGISLEQVVPARTGLHVRVPEDTSIETLRNELSDSIDPLIDTSEVGELWSKQESEQENRSVVGLWSTRTGQGENPASAASRVTAPPVLGHVAAHARNSSSMVRPYAADAQVIVRRYRPAVVDFMSERGEAGGIRMLGSWLLRELMEGDRQVQRGSARI